MCEYHVEAGTEVERISRKKEVQQSKKIGERIKNSLGREKGNCSTTLKKKKEEGEANGFNLIAEKKLETKF